MNIKFTAKAGSMTMDNGQTVGVSAGWRYGDGATLAAMIKRKLGLTEKKE